MAKNPIKPVLINVYEDPALQYLNQKPETFNIPGNKTTTSSNVAPVYEQINQVITNVINVAMPNGNTNEVQFNEGGDLSGDNEFKYDPNLDTLTVTHVTANSVTLGDVTASHIQGGSYGDVLKTDGNGNLSFSNVFPSVSGQSGKVLKTDGITQVWGAVNYNDLTNTPSFATQTYVNTAIGDLINGAPAALDTLNELANALGNNASFASTITNTLADKADISSLATVATTGSYDDLVDTPSIPSIAGLATETFVTNLGYINSSSLATTLTNYATESYVNGRGFITSSTLTNGGYLTTGALTDYALSTDIPTDINQLADIDGLLSTPEVITILGDTTDLVTEANSLTSQLGTLNNQIGSKQGEIGSKQSEISYYQSIISQGSGPFNPGYGSAIDSLNTAQGELSVLQSEYGSLQNQYSSTSMQLSILSNKIANPTGSISYDVGNTSFALSSGIKFPDGTFQYTAAAAGTGNITFSDTTLTSTNGNVKIHFSPTASPAVEFNFAESGEFTAGEVITRLVRSPSQIMSLINTDGVGVRIDSFNQPTSIDIGDTSTWDFVRLRYGSGSVTGNDGDVEIRSTPMGSPAEPSAISISPQGGENGSFIFGGDGSLTLPNTGLIKDSIGRGYINVNTMGNDESIVSLGSNSVDEMVTSVIEIAPNFGIGLTSVRNVDITAGYDSATLKYNTWVEAEQTWVDIRNQDATDIAPGTRTWAGLPSYEAYPLLMQFMQSIPQGEIPPPDSMAPVANTAKAAYEQWQAEQAAIKVTVMAKDKAWTFDNDGTLTVPGSITSDDNLTLNSLGAESGYVAAVVADGAAGRVFVRTLGAEDAILQTWEFNKEGKLILPLGGDIVDIAGQSVLGGSGTSFNFAGQWDYNSPGYNAGDVVRIDSGDLYIALQSVPQTTAAIDNTSYWQLFMPHGATGTNGQNGNDGAPGQGVPTGGTTGQVLAKVDGTDYNTAWVNASTGGDTGNITFSGDTIGSTNNSVNITGSNWAQLETTDGSDTTQIWTELNAAYVNVHGTSWAFTAPTVAGSSSNAFEFPNGIMQRSGDHVNCVAGVDTVIYTSALDTNHTIKLLLNIEGVEDGQTDPDTQSCEMIVAKGFRANSVAGSAYGLVYTSTNPLVTLSTRWNAVDSRVEITCRPVSATNAVNVRSTGIEVASSGAG